MLGEAWQIWRKLVKDMIKCPQRWVVSIVDVFVISEFVSFCRIFEEGFH